MVSTLLITITLSCILLLGANTRAMAQSVDDYVGATTARASPECSIEDPEYSSSRNISVVCFSRGYFIKSTIKGGFICNLIRYLLICFPHSIFFLHNYASLKKCVFMRPYFTLQYIPVKKIHTDSCKFEHVLLVQKNHLLIEFTLIA